MSPYQAINKYIFMPALKEYLAAINMTQKEYLKQHGGVAVLSRLLSEIYYNLVKGPIWAYLHKKGVLSELENEFIEKKGIDAEDIDSAEFEKYVFSKKDVRKVIKTYVRERILPNTDDLVKIYADQIDGDHLKEPTQSVVADDSDELSI